MDGIVIGNQFIVVDGIVFDIFVDEIVVLQYDEEGERCYEVFSLMFNFDEISVFIVYFVDSGFVLIGIKYVVYILCDFFGVEVEINVEVCKKNVVVFQEFLLEGRISKVDVIKMFFECFVFVIKDVIKVE